MGQGPSVEDSLFQLKWTSKSLTRSSKKMEKQERVERQKIKTAIEKGNMEGARIYAENAIRNKNQALNYLRLAGRVDAVAHRVETAVRMQQITKSMAGVTKGMDSVLKSMDLEKITKLMDKFDAQFEDIDVTSKTMEDAMAGSTAMGAPMEQVDSLVAQVAEEHGLEIAGEMVGVPVDAPGGAIAGQDDVTQRLAALNGRK